MAPDGDGNWLERIEIKSRGRKNNERITIKLKRVSDPFDLAALYSLLSAALQCAAVSASASAFATRAHPPPLRQQRGSRINLQVAVAVRASTVERQPSNPVRFGAAWADVVVLTSIV